MLHGVTWLSQGFSLALLEAGSTSARKALPAVLPGAILGGKLKWSMIAFLCSCRRMNAMKIRLPD